MAEQRWTDEQRQRALELHRTVGPAEAARQTGIPKGTVASWARRQGVRTNVAQTLEAATDAAALTAEQKRLELADGLLDDVQRLRRRLFEPMDYVHVKVLSTGQGLPQEVERVHVEVDQPVPADQLRLAQSIVALIEKAQLLTGEATSRDDGTGGYDLEAELRAFQAGARAAT